jgi:putative transposase
VEPKARRRKEPEAGDQWLDRLVDEMYQRMERGERPSLTHLLEELLHRLMERERQRFLEMSKGEQANGFYQRKLYLTLGQLDLKVPKVRRGGAFRPAILPPPWRRVDKDYEELLIAMLANGYSYAQMERALKSLGMPLSREALEDAQALIREQLEVYKTQPLPADWFAIFIDAYWAKLRVDGGKMEGISLFVALGIDLDGFKQVMGFWVLKGRESKAFWAEVLQDLVSRGVHRVLLFVTDDFRGLGEVIGKLFPYAQYHLCLLHLQRNLERGLSREAMRRAREALFRLRRSRDREEGRGWLGKLAAVVASEKPALARQLEAKADGYLAFLDYPEEVRVHIYSTNQVESLNAGIDLMRLELGEYFPSLPCLEVNLFIQVVNLQHQWWRTPVPIIRAASYKLRQLFAIRYELAEEEVFTLHRI